MIAKSPKELGQPQASHLLLVDIGNTRIGLATWSKGKRNPAERFPIQPFEPIGESFAQKWESLPGDAPRAVVISSVNAEILEQLQSFCQTRDIVPLLIIGRELEYPLPVDLSEPERVGTDRLCTAAAAYEVLKTACVVADFGTAVTIDLVADNGIFLGGTIIPGMALAALSLHEHTAALPLVDIGQSTEIVGKNSSSAIRNGIYAMMVGGLREITERIATEIGKWPILVVTGGDAETIAAGCDFVDRVVPDLALDGIALSYLRTYLPDAEQE